MRLKKAIAYSLVITVCLLSGGLLGIMLDISYYMHFYPYDIFYAKLELFLLGSLFNFLFSFLLIELIQILEKGGDGKDG